MCRGFRRAVIGQRKVVDQKAVRVENAVFALDERDFDIADAHGGAPDVDNRIIVFGQVVERAELNLPQAFGQRFYPLDFNVAL